jgi:two-component system phosphate regulon sensor histidine kinase PhoR
MIQSIIDLLEIKANKKNMKLILNKPNLLNEVFVFADKEKIEIVLTNLISNAIKYGKQNGKCEVSVKSPGGKKIDIAVSDDGEGIKKIHLQRIFERFYRIDRHRSREVGGSGLGLSIVKHILEAHGERIYVESEFSIGTSFYFSLPKGS